jgi:hypothetical protein
MVMDKRSCTTVASGPLPNAGSRPSRCSNQGSAIATAVATEHAAKSARATVKAMSAWLQRKNTSGVGPRRKQLFNPQHAGQAAVDGNRHVRCALEPPPLQRSAKRARRIVRRCDGDVLRGLRSGRFERLPFP